MADDKTIPLTPDAEGDADDSGAAAAASDGTASDKTVNLPQVPEDPVVARRLAHGLSAIPTDSQDLDAAGKSTSGGKQTSSGDDASGSGAEGDKKRVSARRDERTEKEYRKKRAKAIRIVILLVLIAAIAAITAYLGWVRWGSIDDVAAIKGKWDIQGTDSSIEITDSRIILTDDVSYDYAIDPNSKTIYYNFGNLKGQGRYRLSLDGNKLSLADGEYSWMSTLISDTPWTFDAVLEQLKGEPAKDPALPGGKSLVRR